MKSFLLPVMLLIFVFSSFGLSLHNKSDIIFNDANRDISGTVTEVNNRFIAGLKVSVINEQTKKQYKTKTNKSGFFIFKNLPLGRYTLKFEPEKNFIPKTVKNIEIGLGGGTVYNTSLTAK